MLTSCLMAVTALIFDTTTLKGDTKAFDEYNAESIKV